MSHHLQPAGDETSDTALHKGRLGVFGIVFFVVAAAAPLVGVTGAVPVAIVVGNGAAVPGAYVAVGLTLLLFSVGYAAMSTQVTNTGAFFAYVGRGLGIGPGVGSAFVSLIAYLAIQLSIFGFFGAVVSAQLDEEFGLSLSWWAWSLMAWGLVLVLSLFSVDVGAKVLGVLMLLEIGSLLLTAVAVLLDGGPEGVDLPASFSPSAVIAGGFAGSAGIALSFAFASYIGFEATAIYGEESRDPKRTVPRATYTAVVLITALFGITTLAVVTGLGSSKVIDEVVVISSVDDTPLVNPAAVLYGVAEQYVGSWLSTSMSWLVISSLFAGLLAFQNSAARYFFSMGRAGVLPRALDRVNAAGAPRAASLVTSVITGLVIVIFAVTDRDPVLNLFYWFSTVAVVAIVLVEALVCLAVIAFFHRHREERRLWHTVIAPAIAFVALVLGEYLLMSRFGLLSGTVREGVDPATEAWGLSPLGWALVCSPFIALVVGWVIGIVRQGKENEDAVKDLVS